MMRNDTPRTSRSFLERRQYVRRLGIITATLCVVSATAIAEPSTRPTAATAPPPASKAKPEKTAKRTAETISDSAAMALFLDRLMMAESGGRDDARNPRSTAVGPFQFIESTFLNVVRAHFAAETGELSHPEILKLRHNRAFARRAAEAFTKDNAAHLAVAGLDASFTNLRLAHLVGAGGAVRVLKAPPTTPAARLLGIHVARANPFLARMTAAGLVQWSERNLSAAALADKSIAVDTSRLRRSASAPRTPAINVRCNRSLVSCQRWIALAKSRLTRKERVANARARQRR